MNDECLQRPNIYNQYLPFSSTIIQQASTSFEEIRENLSRSIQLIDFQVGLRTWTTKLKQFISLYGFSFSKIDHVKLVRYYISILSITDLNCFDALYCIEMLGELLQYVIIY